MKKTPVMDIEMSSKPTHSRTNSRGRSSTQPETINITHKQLRGNNFSVGRSQQKPNVLRKKKGSWERSRRTSSMLSMLNTHSSFKLSVNPLGSFDDDEENDEENDEEEDTFNTSRKHPSDNKSKGKKLWQRMKNNSPLLNGSQRKSHIGGESNRMMLLEEHHGIPIKETMKTLYSVRRLKFLWESLILVVTLSLFYGITSQSMNRRTAYEQELTILESIQDEEFAGATYKKNYLEIRSIDEFWQWMEGPLLGALYSTDNDEPLAQVDYMNQYLRLVGGVQIRQFRVRNDSCKNRRRTTTTWKSKVDTKDGTCFAAYGPEEADPIVPKWATGETQNSSTVFGHWGHCGPDGCVTFLQDEVLYGKKGYYINIPPSSTLYPYNNKTNLTASNMVESLKKDSFFDRGTRAIAIEATFFNTNTEIMTISRFIIEQFPSGLIEASVKYRHARLAVLVSKTDTLRICGSVVYVLLMLYQFQREVKRMLKTRPLYRYFLNAFSYLEILYFVFHGIYMIKWITFVFFSQRTNFDVNRIEFVSYFDMAHELFKTWQFAGFSFLIGCFKLMRFLSLNARVAVMWQAIVSLIYFLNPKYSCYWYVLTFFYSLLYCNLFIIIGNTKPTRTSLDLTRLHSTSLDLRSPSIKWDSAPDLVAFMASFFLLLLGFGFLAHMMWGSHTPTFTTIYRSGVSLFRFWIDDFPYDVLYETNPDTYYTFFIPFALLITLVVQNIFVAIIINAFSTIHAQSKEEHWKHDLPGLLFEVRKRTMLTWFHIQLRCKIRICWPSLRYVFCCCCNYSSSTIMSYNNSSRWSLDELIEDENHLNVAKNILGNSLNQHLVWARELEFYHILAIAARHARRQTMSGGTISSMFEYFRRAYREHPTNEACFMSLHELCAITHPRHLDKGHSLDTLRNCNHSDCLASVIIDAYNKYKSVLIIGGKQREAAVVQTVSGADMKEQKFLVIKTNNVGRQQRRILVIDQQRQEIRSFDEKMRLHVILPLSKLHQLENLEADERSLELCFEEGVYTYCELQFISISERTRFIEIVMKQHESVEKVKKSKTAGEPLNILQQKME